MKAISTTLLALLFLSFSLPANIFSQSDWALRTTGSNLNSIHALDMSTAWCVGDSGAILATIDGGSNWICISSGTSQSLRSVFFLNSMTGWTCGYGGIILKSIDGGDSWTSMTSGTTSNLNSIFFPSADTGFAVGPSVTLKSTDGGTSWVSLISVSGSALYFSSGLKGLATNSSGTLSRTTNGGSAWFTNVVAYPSNRYDVSFTDTLTGWVSGFGTSVNKTTNGGDNWTTQPTGLSGFPYLYGIDFVDPSTGYSVGSSGIIIKTTNGGSNWSAESSGTVNSLNKVKFVDALYGWAVGDKGTILLTTNGGSTWSHQTWQYTSPFSQTYSINDVEFLDELTGWSVGFLGTVNKTSDGGRTWSSASSASFNWLYSLSFLNEGDTGFVCGRLGTIEKTTNSGVNWTLNSAITSQHLNSIVVKKFAGDTLETAWCAGNNGTLLLTNNGGFTWGTVATLTTTNDLNSVHVWDKLNVIVAGNSGSVFKTTNGGINWTSLSPGTSENIRSIHFISSLTGFICGTGGMLRTTTDGGSTWSPQSSGVSGTLNSITFEDVDNENGYSVGDNGVILSTTNYGSVWFVESSGGSVTLNSVFAKSNHSGPDGPIVGIAGTIGKFLRRLSPIALPVELTYLTASVNDNNITLNWETSGEINNLGFQIQRSSGSGWSVIGFVSGKGTTNMPSHYRFTDNGLLPGTYFYRLKQTDINGNYRFYETDGQVSISAPDSYNLEQNYPNPFNPTTKIKYSLPNSENVTLSVFDMTGREVSSIVKGYQKAGSYSVDFRPVGLASGVYVYVLKTESFSASRKLMLIK